MRTRTTMIGLLVALGMTVACDSTDSLLQPAPQPAGSTAPFVVSDPVAASPSHINASGLGNPSVIYISLPPGTIANGTFAAIHAPGAGSLRVTIVEGGFDPVAVRASAGDSISVVVNTTPGSNAVTYVFAVPMNAKPRIIRTNPPRNKRDVALNARPLVVFSEPIDAGSLTNGSIQLRKGSTVVPGQLAFGNPEQTLIEFAPLAALEPAATYELVVSESVRDLDAAALDSGTTVPFTTAAVSPPAPPALSVLRTSPLAGERDVRASNSIVEIWFSEGVNLGSIYSSDGRTGTAPRARIYRGAELVSFRYTCLGRDADRYCTSVVLAPDSPLIAGVEYRVVLDAGITGASGATLPAQVTFSFTTAQVQAGPPSASPSVMSFQMIEYKYPSSAQSYYAPLLRIAETGGRSALSIDKLVFHIPGFPGPTMPLCSSGRMVMPGEARDMFVEVYGDYQISFFVPGGVPVPGDATVDIHYSDDEGRTGVLNARTTVTAGQLPNTYTGGENMIPWVIDHLRCR